LRVEIKGTRIDSTPKSDVCVLVLRNGTYTEMCNVKVIRNTRYSMFLNFSFFRLQSILQISALLTWHQQGFILMCRNLNYVLHYYNPCIILIYVNKTMIIWSMSPPHGASSGCGWRNGLRIWRVAANTLNKQSRTAEKGWPFSLGVGRGANNSSP
jgi:uncharacterized membrane protein